MADKPSPVASAQPIKVAGLANPAAVGLGAFASTTLLLQFHNLSFIHIGSGVVMWLAFFFGGLAQFIAGLQEFKTGNNFGYAAFVTYGAFWIALGGIFLTKNLGLFAISDKDVAYFLIIFTILTLIYLFGAMKQNTGISIVFLTLFIGYVLLDIHFLIGETDKVWLNIAGIELIVCAASAFYMMAHVVMTPLKINVPAGPPWSK
jgi:uncharacterized protein